MLVITLGSHASGSTWLFNVVLLLFEAAGRPVFCTAVDEGEDALDRMPVDMGDVVLKSHSMDQRLLRIARLAGARIVLSVRDPRDSVVSQRERFGAPVRRTVAELSRSLATINSLAADLPVLRFRYEDRFIETARTIAAVARFLGVPAAKRDVARIASELSIDAVRSRVAVRSRQLTAGETPCQEPVTQWHHGHVGDGVSGKWRDRLDPASQRLVADCLNPFAAPGGWRKRPVRWSAELFDYQAKQRARPTVEIRAGPEPDFIAYGPYLHLPVGAWRATPLVRSVEGRCGALLEADIYLPWADRQLACVRAPVGREDAPVSLDFTRYDHYQPVEARLRTVERRPRGFVFSGWRLSWRGA